MNHILLYSKYSRSCLRLLDMVDELNNIVQLSLVCIDNKEIRKQVCSSKMFEITKVPCMLIVGQDGTVEKYEGEKVFLWMNEVMENVKKAQPQIQSRIQPQPQMQSRIQPQMQSQEDEDFEVDDQPKKGKKPNEKINMTRIEDLDDTEEDDDNEDEVDEPVKVKRPPIPIRNGAGNYSFENNIEEEPSTSKYKSKKKVKKKSTDSDKGNIMDMAMAMRQEREKENKSDE